MVTSTDSGADDRHEQLALMRELLVTLPAAVAYVAGPDLVFEFANDEYLRTVGGRDLVGLPIRDALPELSPERLAPLERVVRSGQPVRGQASEVWIRQDGAEPQQMFVDFACLPVRDASGGVAGVLLHLNDVTPLVLERRRREELIGRLARTEERYRTLFETLPHGVIHYRADNTIIGINPAASEMLGLTGHPVTSSPLLQARRAVHEDGTPFRPDEVPVTIALRTGKIVADVVAGVPQDRTGEIRWLRVTAVPDARDERGRPQRAYTILTDITEQHRAEAALRQSNRLLGRLREANVLGVIVVGEDGEVHEANDAYLEIIGYTRDDLESGRISWREMTPAKWADSDQGQVEQLRQTGACQPFEKEYVHRDGHLVPVLIGAAVIDRQPLRWTSFVIDLTARQRREQERATMLRALNVELEERVSQRTSQLIRTEADRRELEAEIRKGERLQTVGQLTSGIAHDFGNLLGVIVGYAEMAEDVGADLDPELHRILGEIRGAADRAVHLTSDLLRFGRRTRARPEKIDINELVDSIKDLLRVSMSGCAEVVFEPSPAAPSTVLADREQMEQVLLNLAVNARDAMPEGCGTLRISTRPADIGAEQKHHQPGSGTIRYIELDVQDNGMGMSAEVRARIFERFFTTKPPGTGTGLGLSTVQGIIADAGGRIEVDSAEGQGTTFRIYLPAVSSPLP